MNHAIQTPSIKNEPQNCWDFNKCPEEIRKKCEAYMKSFGTECWFVVKDVTKGRCPKQEGGGCINCSWYKKLNPE